MTQTELLSQNGSRLYFASELVADSLKAMGVTVKVDSHVVTPSDVANSKMLERIYPTHAGFTDASTSRQAAVDITQSGRKDKLQAVVMAVLKNHSNGLTPDECANYMEVDILSIRPRFTELKRLGLIEDTGERRLSNNGKMQKCWRMK